ncbi:MAG: hypothetical protein PHR66_02335 [Desulfuromonadaceae bacterium]|nr:hypothetical protein [Desulfuromonadaceae bacterium]
MIGNEETKDHTIYLLTNRDDVTFKKNRVGLLFECAPDSPILAFNSEVTMLTELIGDFDVTKEHAYCLAKTILHGEPEFRGIKQLGIFEEVVIRELQFILHSIQLHNSLKAMNIESCHVTSRNRCIDGLTKILEKVQSPIKLSFSGSQPSHSSWSSLSGRIAKRLKDSKFSFRSLKSEYQQVMARVDPFHRRNAWQDAIQHQSYTPSKVWFYSTSYTFTRIGLMYEPFFKDGFAYLIENPLTGGRALEEAGRGHVGLYRFTKRGMGPTREDISQAKGQIVRHINGVSLSGDDALARDLFLDSDWLALFMNRHLPFGLFQSALFTTFLEIVQPSAIVVGNPVHEAYLLHCAKKSGIPTILLQHGILGDFCQLLDPPTDYYVVRGRFWQEFLSRDAQKRSIILNPPQTSIPSRKAAVNADQERHILFLTAPYGVHEFMHLTDLDDILASMLQVAFKEKMKLVVRVHPSETVGYYQQIVSRLISELSLRDVRVEYSHGPGLEQLVRESAVAVTYCSTVFLDCLREGIPLISFGWHDFSFKKQIEAVKVFHFADTLEELRSLVADGAKGKLAAFAGSVEPFLAGTRQEELESFFANAISGKLKI